MRKVLAMVAVTAVVLVITLYGRAVLAVEQPDYRVLMNEGKMQIRAYPALILAEVMVSADFEEAGSVAFRKLFRYISGENRDRRKISMTAPVAQEPGSRKIAMTAPVSQTRSGDRWAVAFIMPSEFTMQTIPEPVDPDVHIREVPPRTVAAIRYRGTWSVARYQAHLDQLNRWIAEKGMTVVGEPVWARYNPPITPWFLRRNEILIPVSTPQEGANPAESPAPVAE